MPLIYIFGDTLLYLHQVLLKPGQPDVVQSSVMLTSKSESTVELFYCIEIEVRFILGERRDPFGKQTTCFVFSVLFSPRVL